MNGSCGVDVFESQNVQGFARNVQPNSMGVTNERWLINLAGIKNVVLAIHFEIAKYF